MTPPTSPAASSPKPRFHKPSPRFPNASPNSMPCPLRHTLPETPRSSHGCSRSQTPLAQRQVCAWGLLAGEPQPPAGQPPGQLEGAEAIGQLEGSEATGTQLIPNRWALVTAETLSSPSSPCPSTSQLRPRGAAQGSSSPDATGSAGILPEENLCLPHRHRRNSWKAVEAVPRDQPGVFSGGFGV